MHPTDHFPGDLNGYSPPKNKRLYRANQTFLSVELLHTILLSHFHKLLVCCNRLAHKIAIFVDGILDPDLDSSLFVGSSDCILLCTPEMAFRKVRT